jgi:hypothetical protein
MKRYSMFMVILVIVCMAFIYGCGSNATSGGGGGSSGGGGISGRQYYGMCSDGPIVKCTVNDTAFQIDFVTGGSMAGTTITGTVTQLASGLLSCEVTGSNNSAPDTKKGTLYAYEVTNEVLVVGNGGPDNQKVFMVLPALASTAPYPLAGSYEAVTIPRTDWILPGNLDACMTGEITGTTSYKFEVTMFTVAGAFKDSGSIESLQYTEDRVYKTDNEPQFFFSPKGLFVASGGKDSGGWKDGGIVGAIYDNSVTTSDVTNNRNYIGISFIRNLANNNTSTEAVSMESVATQLKAYSMDASSGAATNLLGTITLGSMGSPGQGIIDATIGPKPAKMVAYKYNDSGKYALCGFVSMDSDAMSFFVIEK